MRSTLLDEGRPDGLLVGRALAVPDGPFHHDLRIACRLIDRVHGDGALPTIPATLVPGLGRRGRFLYDEPRGVPLAIRVNADLSGRSFHALHEIGHFLDFSGIGQPGTWASRVDPALEDWRRAVRRSRACRQLRALARRTMVTVMGPDGVPTDIPVRRLAIEPLLPMEEFWARSYAQYVTVVTGDSDAMTALTALVRRSPGSVYIPVQWEQDDFSGIAEAIERLFRRLRWRAISVS